MLCQGQIDAIGNSSVNGFNSLQIIPNQIVASLTVFK